MTEKKHAPGCMALQAWDEPGACTCETDRWVARVNKAARDLDSTASALHPSAWPEALASQRAVFRKLATSPEGPARE